MTSPPYGASGWKADEDPANPIRRNTERRKLYPCRPEIEPGRYSDNPANIGNLKDVPLKAILSPPYSEAHHAEGSPGGILDTNRQDLQKWVWTRGTQGQTEGQIANLPDKPLKCLLSPPYEDSTLTQDTKFIAKIEKEKRRGSRFQGGSDGQYGEATGQLGKERGQSYLSEMQKVYTEIARVADVLCIILKDPTRGGKIRTLGLDTWRILEDSGLWEVVDYHRAILFEETETATLFGDKVKKPKGRVSFFKQLAYKRGSPISQWEHIIIARRRNGRGKRA